MARRELSPSAAASPAPMTTSRRDMFNMSSSSAFQIHDVGTDSDKSRHRSLTQAGARLFPPSDFKSIEADHYCVRVSLVITESKRGPGSRWACPPTSAAQWWD